MSRSTNNTTSRSNSSAAVTSEANNSIASTAASTFNALVTKKNKERATVVLEDFIRKEDERNKAIAIINNELVSLNEKLDKAEKGSNVAALTKQIAYKNADLAEINTLKTNAASKRDAFITAFDADAYTALADTSLVREEIAKKLS